MWYFLYIYMVYGPHIYPQPHDTRIRDARENRAPICTAATTAAARLRLSRAVVCVCASRPAPCSLVVYVYALRASDPPSPDTPSLSGATYASVELIMWRLDWSLLV